jgi:hypothetical protein
VKRKGVIVRWDLKEARSKHASRPSVSDGSESQERASLGLSFFLFGDRVGRT